MTSANRGWLSERIRSLPNVEKSSPHFGSSGYPAPLQASYPALQVTNVLSTGVQGLKNAIDSATRPYGKNSFTRKRQPETTLWVRPGLRGKHMQTSIT